jgi:hypothetical protein
MMHLSTSLNSLSNPTEDNNNNNNNNDSNNTVSFQDNLYTWFPTIIDKCKGTVQLYLLDKALIAKIHSYVIQVLGKNLLCPGMNAPMVFCESSKFIFSIEKGFYKIEEHHLLGNATYYVDPLMLIEGMGFYVLKYLPKKLSLESILNTLQGFIQENPSTIIGDVLYNRHGIAFSGVDKSNHASALYWANPYDSHFKKILSNQKDDKTPFAIDINNQLTYLYCDGEGSLNYEKAKILKIS